MKKKIYGIFLLLSGLFILITVNNDENGWYLSLFTRLMIYCGIVCVAGAIIVLKKYFKKKKE